MGKKVEYFGLFFIMAVIIFMGIFVGNIWSKNVQIQNTENFLQLDSIVCINGTVQEINYPELDKMIIKINNKFYDISEHILSCFLGDCYIDEDKLELLYYALNIGDNITIFSSNRVLINGEIFQNGEPVDETFVVWLVVGVICFGLAIFDFMVILGFFDDNSMTYIKSWELSSLKSFSEKNRENCKYLEKEKEKYKQKYLDLLKTSQSSHKLEEFFCDECGTKLDSKNNVCQYCGNEVHF